MNAKELKQVALLLANINLNRIALIYGHNLEELAKPCSSYSYLKNKLAQAINNPIYWINSLDNTNLQNLCEVAKTIS